MKGFRSTIKRLQPPAKRCPLHDIELEERQVEVRYGLVKQEAWMEQLESEAVPSFPHAEDYIFAYDCRIPAQPKYRAKLICRSCVEARNQWVEQQRSVWQESQLS